MQINGVDVIEKFDKVKVNGLYLIPTDEEYDNNGYMCIHVIGYNRDENDIKRYYDFGDCHDVISLMNFGLSGISMDVEKENGYIRVFWTDRKPREVNNIDAFISIFTLYGEEITL